MAARPENVATPNPADKLSGALQNIGAHREAMKQVSQEIASQKEETEPPTEESEGG